MSFNIELKTNKSPMNYINKDIVDVITLQGTLRDGANVVDPVILVEISNDAEIIGVINYAYIPIMGRFYYITNITSEHKGLWSIEMHCDVLMTYKDDIKLQTAIVSRQENIRNMYLDDGSFMAYQNPYIFTRYFSNPTPFSAQEYVLIVAGS